MGMMDQRPPHQDRPVDTIWEHPCDHLPISPWLVTVTVSTDSRVVERGEKTRAGA